jgi:hypothetical protein
VVSWNDAAAKKLSVKSDDLVTPNKTGLAVAGSPASARIFAFLAWKSKMSMICAGI